jgi:hypothetical protein
MTEKRNKHWRFLQSDKLYIAKMKLFAAYGGTFDIEDEWIRNPRWIVLYDVNWCPQYKSMRTPCSCFVCRGEKYNRCANKQEMFRIIDECL